MTFDHFGVSIRIRLQKLVHFNGRNIVGDHFWMSTLVTNIDVAIIKTLVIGFF